MVKNILKRAITLIATTTLTIGLIGACTLREEEQKMEQCAGTIYTLRTAILYPLIDSFPYLRVFSTDAQVVDGTPKQIFLSIGSAEIMRHPT